MSLRLLTVGLICFAQVAMAQDALFEAELAKYQERLPADCKIQSAAMKLAYTCSAIQAKDANPRFYRTVDATNNGVNYCYNAIISVTQNGSQLGITVLRDKGQSVARTRYHVSKPYLKSTGDETILPLPELKANCFMYSKSSSLCSGSDIKMALKIKDLNGPKLEHDVVSDRSEIDSNRRNENQLKPLTDVNRDETDRMAVSYARQQLVAFAKKSGVPVATDAFQRCDRMMIEMENKFNPPAKPDAEEEKLLASFRKQTGYSGGAESGGGAGSSGSSGRATGKGGQGAETSR